MGKEVLKIFGEIVFSLKYHVDTPFPESSMEKVLFRNGYSKNSPSFVAKCSLSIGTGKEEWGAEKDKQYFVLTIHEILKGSD